MWHTFTDSISHLCTPDNTALEAASELFRPVTLKRNTFLVKEGEVCTTLGFVYRGLFRSFYINEEGDDVTYCFAMEGETETSFESFITGNPSRLSIVAMEDSTVLMIEKKDLDVLLNKYLFWNKLSRILTEKEYLKMTRHASESKTGSAKTRYLNILEHQPELLQRVPLHYIASYLGISSRHLTRMRRAVTL